MASPELSAEFRDLLAEMCGTWVDLPPPDPIHMPEATRGALARVEAVGVIHGWMARLVRSTEAVLLLVDRGYTVEAAPVIRSMIEHAIALWWLVDQRGDAFQVLVRVRGKAAAKLQSAQEIGWQIEGEEAQRLLQKLIDEETDDETLTFDFLAATAAQAKKYGLGALYQAWLLETGSSHARIDSARPYYLHVDGTEAIELLQTPRDTGAEPEAALTSVIHTALAAYNQLLISDPLTEQLKGWTERFTALAARLAEEITMERAGRTPAN